MLDLVSTVILTNVRLTNDGPSRLVSENKTMFTEQGSWFAPLTADLTNFSKKILKYTGATIGRQPLQSFLAFRPCSDVWNRNLTSFT